MRYERQSARLARYSRDLETHVHMWITIKPHVSYTGTIMYLVGLRCIGLDDALV